jgi:hypothetical protein
LLHRKKEKRKLITIKNTKTIVLLASLSQVQLAKPDGTT